MLMDSVVKGKTFGKVFRVQLLQDVVISGKYNYDPFVLFIVGGRVTVKSEQGDYILEAGDIAYFEPDGIYTVTSVGKDRTVLMVSVSYSDFSALAGKQSICIFCNSALEGGSRYERIRFLLNRILEALQSGRNTEEANIISLLYQVFYCLISDFQVSVQRNKSKEDNRVEEIRAYLNANYSKNISLLSLANHLGLTKEYVSRYFHNKLGCTFHRYLEDIRMSHALEELRRTNKTVLNIALDNGFSSTSAMARVIKDRCQMTPLEVRKNRSLENEHNNKEENESSRASCQLFQTVYNYVKQNAVDGKTDENIIIHEVTVDSLGGAKWSKSWNRLISVGRSANILTAEVQKALLRFHSDLGIAYVRINHIWDPDICLIQKRNNSLFFNFSQLDKIFIFLIGNGMRPFIDLDWVKEGSKLVDGCVEEVQKRFIREFLNHYHEIFGQKELSRWIFDEIMPENIERAKFVKSCVHTVELLHELSDKILIGSGIEHLVKEDEIAYFIQAWPSNMKIPDFFILDTSVSRQNNGVMSDAQKDGEIAFYMDKNFFRNYCWGVREILDINGWNHVKICVPDWDFSNENNVLNDEPFKGAWILKNAIDSIGSVDMLGYRTGIDEAPKVFEKSPLLSGDSGLLNYNTIAKPAYFSMEFLNSSKESLLYKDDFIFITTDDFGHFSILCENYKHPNYYYFTRNVNDIREEDITRYFSNQNKLNLTMHLINVRDGVWAVRTHSVNNSSGNLKEYWKQLGTEKNLLHDDIHYLQNICRPKLEIERIHVKNGILTFSTRLETNEFKYIHIIHMRNE